MSGTLGDVVESHLNKYVEIEEDYSKDLLLGQGVGTEDAILWLGLPNTDSSYSAANLYLAALDLLRKERTWDGY